MNSVNLQLGKFLWTIDEKIATDAQVCVNKICLLIEQLELHQWDAKIVFGIHMAMEEALMNAVKHGNESDPDKQIHLFIGLSSNSCYARITDQGRGFNPDAVPDPTLDENLEKCTGRGLMLMRTYMDQVVFNPVGNSVEMVKVRD